MSSRCPTCDRPLPETRLGVKFTPLKARIFDVIKRAGATGITTEDLFGIVFAERGNVSVHTLKSHVHQINDAIEDAGFRITSIDRHWVLMKVQMELSL